MNSCYTRGHGKTDKKAAPAYLDRVFRDTDEYARAVDFPCPQCEAATWTADHTDRDLYRRWSQVPQCRWLDRGQVAARFGAASRRALPLLRQRRCHAAAAHDFCHALARESWHGAVPCPVLPRS